MTSPFDFNESVQPVSLPSQNQDTEGGANATVVGYGDTSVIIKIFMANSIDDKISSM